MGGNSGNELKPASILFGKGKKYTEKGVLPESASLNELSSTKPCVALYQLQVSHGIQVMAWHALNIRPFVTQKALLTE